MGKVLGTGISIENVGGRTRVGKMGGSVGARERGRERGRERKARWLGIEGVAGAECRMSFMR